MQSRKPNDTNSLKNSNSNSNSNSYKEVESAFSPYKQKGYAEELGATDHTLTESESFRAHLDKNGQHGAEVYNWHISKLPDDQIVPMDVMDQLVRQLHTAAQVLYTLHGDKTTEDTVRRELVGDVEAFEKLTHTHPRLFFTLTERKTTTEVLTHVLNMIHMKQQHQQQNVSLKTQQQDISSYMHAMFVRPAKEGEEEAAIAAGTGVHGELVPAHKK